MEDQTLQTHGGNLADETSCPTCGLKLSRSVTNCPQDGTLLRAPADHDPDLSAKYTFLATVGEGGMGVIYKARQVILNKIVAIKIIHPHLCNARTISRLQVEGRAASALSHPSIVSVHDCGVTQNGQPYLVMDYIEGKTLADILSKEGTLSTQRVVSLSLQICDALAHSHSKSVLHRDLKPSNIMITRTDDGTEKVRIMDFGIAKILDDTEGGAVQQLTRTGEAVGSPMYMSPEQCRGKAVDHRSDLYSLGCVIYECLTGAPPFMGNNAIETMMMHMNEKPIAMSEASLGSKPDERLEQIVVQLLQKDPAARFQSMKQVMDELRSIEDARADSSADSNKQAKTRHKTSPSHLQKQKISSVLKGAGAIALISMAIFLAFKLHHDPPSEPTNNRPIGKTNPGQKAGAQKDSQQEAATPSLEELITSSIKSKVESKSSSIDFPHWNNFQSIVLTDEELKPLEQATELRELIFPIVPSDVTDAGLSHLATLHLQVLNLDHSKVASLAALNNMTSLTDLSLAFTALDSNGIKTISSLLNLETLNLQNTSITDADLMPLRSLSKLRAINISGCDNIDIDAALKLKKDMTQCDVTISSLESLMTTGQEIIEKAQKEEKDGKHKDAVADFQIGDKRLAAAMKLINRSNPIKYQLLMQCIDTRVNCYFDRGLFQEAIDFSDKGLSVARHLGLTAKVLQFLRLKSEPLKKLKEWEKVMQNCQQIDQIYRSQNERSLEVLQNREDLAKVYIMDRKFEKAAETLLKILSEYASIHKGGSRESGSPEELLGDVYRCLHENSKAVPHYLNAIKIFQQAGWPGRQRDVEINLATSYNYLHRYKEEEAIRKRLLISLPKGARHQEQEILLKDCQEQLTGRRE